MKKLLVFFLVFSIYSYASLVGSNFSQRDIQVLEDLDINSSFITDYKLQEVYQQYLRRNSNHYVTKLNEASLFVPRVKDILKQEGIPDVFIYMAMAESNFTIDARSNVKATGLWQFMYSTGRRYGLKNDIYVDERMDLVKSTVAAASYLNSLYNKFDKWYLAAIAYNCGEGRVIEALTRAILDIYVEENPEEKNSKKIKEYREYIKKYQERRTSFYKIRKIYNEISSWGVEPDLTYLLKEQKGMDRQYLPKESRRYIRKIISLAMLNSKSFITNEENSHLLNMGISTTVATVPVKGGLHLKNIAKTIGMSYDELHKLNKHLKQGIVPPYETYYPINIPYSRLARYNEKKETIPDTQYAIHIVRRGDSLYGISKKYKVPLKMIKEHNNLNSSKLSIKQEIVLPIPNDMVGKINLFTYDYSKDRFKKKHVVKSGESLYSIAKKYKVDAKKIMQRNNMKTTLLKIGDRLVIR